MSMQHFSHQGIRESQRRPGTYTALIGDDDNGLIEYSPTFKSFWMSTEFRRWLMDNRQFLIRTYEHPNGILVRFPNVQAAMAFKFRWA